MKKFTLLFLVAVLVVNLFFLSGASAKQPVIAVSFPGSVEFFSVERKGMDKAAKDYGLQVIINPELSIIPSFSQINLSTRDPNSHRPAWDFPIFTSTTFARGITMGFLVK